MQYLFYDSKFDLEEYIDLNVEENIYDHVLAVTFRIFGEQDMGLSNEHRDGRFTVFTTGLLGARHTTLKRLCSFREQFFGHRGGKITKGEENLNQLLFLWFSILIRSMLCTL